jgi:hypothetical protein
MIPKNWTINRVCIGSLINQGEARKIELTAYHSPGLKRTIMGGPGNRSSIVDCSCGGRRDGGIGRDHQMCDWYARHAGISGGGDAVAAILRQYDEARDVADYPDHPRNRGMTAVNPSELLAMLRA